jgi:hypothetical protein
MFSVPNEAGSDLAERIAALGMLLLVLALPALYASERGWFGRLAPFGFWSMAVGWTVAAVAALRSDAATVPRLGAWLLVAAIPVGLPLTIGFTLYVMGELAEPWAGPLLLYAVVWIVFGRFLWDRRAETPATEVTA